MRETMKASLRERIVYGSSCIIAGWWLKLTCGVTVRGVENVPGRGPCIIVSNHASYLDPPIIAATIRQRFIRFLARDTLLSSPLARWYFISIRAITIDRNRGDVVAMKGVLRALKDGETVALFPEGTRSRDGELQPPKRGIGFVLSRAQVDVVPVYVDGTFKAMPRGTSKIKRHPLQVIIGEPIPAQEIADLGKGKEAYGKASDLVMKRIAALVPTHG